MTTSQDQIPVLQQKLRLAHQAVMDSIDGIAEAEIRQVPAPGEWTVAQLLAHIAEIQYFWMEKAVLITSEDDPNITRSDVENDRRATAVADHAGDPLDDLVRGLTTANESAVATTGAITTPLGRHRFFFGRRDDPHTARQAIAFIPQSMVADILNAALWWVWKDLDTVGPPRGVWDHPVELLAQVHDAILGQVWKGDDAALTQVLRRMTLPVEIGGRTMTIPVEMMRGKNWGKASDKNPGGLRKWSP